MQHTMNHLGQPIGFPLPGWTPPPRPSRRAMEGRFCRLEPLDPAAHAADLHAANQLDTEGRMWTWLPYGPFPTAGGYRDWLEKSYAGDDPLFFAIVEKSAGKAVGVASYMRIDPPNGTIEIGHVAFSPLLQRTTAAGEAMYRMLHAAFELGYRRCEWKCDALNAPSRAAAQRLGLSFEGLFRQAAVVKGRNRDTAWYAVVDTEWPALQDAFSRWLDPANFDDQGRQRLRLSDLTGPLVQKRGWMALRGGETTARHPQV